MDARGWVKNMPNAHNGYLDTQLETGYVGLAFLLTFVIATLHAIGGIADKDPGRAWLVLSLALFAIITNFLESTWFRAFDMLWTVFLLVVAEAARSWEGVPRVESSGGTVLRNFQRGAGRGRFRPATALRQSAGRAGSRVTNKMRAGG